MRTSMGMGIIKPPKNVNLAASADPFYIATNRPIIIKRPHPPRNPARDSPVRRLSQVWLRSRQTLSFSRQRPLKTGRILLTKHVAVFRRKGVRRRGEFFVAVVVPVGPDICCSRKDVLGENILVTQEGVRCGLRY
jgi:hypothetical protein